MLVIFISVLELYIWLLKQHNVGLHLIQTEVKHFETQAFENLYAISRNYTHACILVHFIKDDFKILDKLIMQ